MLFVSGVDPGVRGFEESGPGVELNSNDTAATTFEEDSALKVSAFFKSQFHALWKQSVDHIRSRRPQTGGDLNYREHLTAAICLLSLGLVDDHRYFRLLCRSSTLRG